MKTNSACLYVMAKQTLSKWYKGFSVESMRQLTDEKKRIAISAKCAGLVWHDRYKNFNEQSRREVFNK